MSIAPACLVALLLAAAEPSEEARDEQAQVHAAWEIVFAREAADYEIYRDDEYTQPRPAGVGIVARAQ